MKSVLQQLKEIDAIFSTQEKWIKGCNAIDAQGHLCHPLGLDACKWCLIGALVKVVGSLSAFNAHSAHDTIINAINETYTNSHEDTLWRFNDNEETTFEDVKKVLKRAMELAVA